MTNFNWKSGDSGNWGTPGNWQQNSVPNSTAADVTIASSTDIGVTIAAGQSFAADSVTLGSSAVTLDVAGRLNLGGGTKDQLILNTGTLNMLNTGTLNMGLGGTLADGTIIAGTGVLEFGNDSTLTDITYVGDLNLTTDRANLNIVGGLTVENAGGGPGTINISASYVYFDFETNGTLDNVSINLGAGGSGPTGGSALSAGNGHTLTLGSDATLNSDPSTNPNQATNSLDGTDIVNQGLINVISGTLEIAPDTFSNLGTIDVFAGAYVVIGAIDMSNVGTVIGTGTIDLKGDHRLANLDGISLSGGGLLNIAGDLNLEGGTLAVGGNDNIAIGNGAKIVDGTINASLGTPQFGPNSPSPSESASDKLVNVTWIGDLNVAASYYQNNQGFGESENLTIAGAFTLANASGTGPGTINIPYGASEIDFTETHETLNNVGINLGAAGAMTQYADILGGYGTGDVLIFGNTTTIDSYSSDVNVIAGNKIVNDGVMNITGGFLINPATFTNAGTINLFAGGYIRVDSRLVTNTGLIEGTGAGTDIVNVPTYVSAAKKTFFGTTLTGGTLEANAGNTLALDLEGRLITSDDATLILNGMGSEIKENNLPLNKPHGTYMSLESTLETIGNGGTLELLGGRGYTTGNTLDIADGTLLLGGGTFTAASLDLATGSSKLTGFGTVADAISNAGIIEAAGGTLVIDGPLSGGGSFQIDASSTLELTTGTSDSVSFTGANGGLILEAPASFTGTLGGIAPGDSIALAGETASSASISGTSLLVTLTNHSVLDYTLASALPMEGVSISNSSGGAELTFYQLPAAPEMQFMRPSAAVADTATPRPASLPALRDLWSGATHYRPFLTAHFGQASVTNLRHLQSELGNVPTPANAGIVLAALQNWEYSRIINHDLALAPPKG